MFFRRILLASCLLLPACAPTPTPAPAPDWNTFADPEFAITFDYPPTLTRDAEIDREGVNFGDTVIQAKAIALRAGMAESQFIEVMQSDDPAIVTALTANAASLAETIVNGEEVQVFREQGMGDPVEYLFQKNGQYIVLTFVFPPTQSEIDRVLSSVVLH